MQTIIYPYSKISSAGFTIFFSGLIFMSAPQLIKFIDAGDSVNWLLILGADFLVALMLLYIIIKQLMPALKEKTALELTTDSLISYSKKVTITWKDMDEIELKKGKTSSALYITFKWKTDHGDSIRIPIGFVKGNDQDIYNTVMEYYYKSNSI